MFNDHLKQDGVFGPEHDKYKTFKDYMFSELEAASSKFSTKLDEDKKIQSATNDKINQIMQRIDGEVTNKFSELTIGRDGILEKIQEMETFTLTPLQAGAIEFQKKLDKTNEQVAELDARSKDDKKLRDLGEIMENKIETQVKALK